MLTSISTIQLKTSLYRHPWDDITYLLPTLNKTPGNEGRVEVEPPA